MTRVYRLLITSARWSLAERGERLWIVFDLDAPPSPGARCAIEFALAEPVHFSRLLSSVPVEVVEVTFPHAPPADESGYRQLFRCPIAWNRERAAWFIDRTVLELRQSSADPSLLP